MKLLQLNEQVLSDSGDDSARIASDVHLLVVAMQTEYDLPSFGKAWLARWVNSRAEELDAALVGLVTNDVVVPDSHSGLIAHLETVAFVGRLAFFYGGASANGESFKADSSTHPPLGRRRLLDRQLQPAERQGAARGQVRPLDEYGLGRDNRLGNRMSPLSSTVVKRLITPNKQ